MTFNAYVSVDNDGRIYDGSTVTVDGVCDNVPVPENAGELGGIMFWPRVRAALKPHGLRLDHAISNHILDGGVVRFNAKPGES